MFYYIFCAPGGQSAQRSPVVISLRVFPLRRELRDICSDHIEKLDFEERKKSVVFCLLLPPGYWNNIV